VKVGSVAVPAVTVTQVQSGVAPLAAQPAGAPALSGSKAPVVQLPATRFVPGALTSSLPESVQVHGKADQNPRLKEAAAAQARAKAATAAALQSHEPTRVQFSSADTVQQVSTIPQRFEYEGTTYTAFTGMQGLTLVFYSAGGETQEIHCALTKVLHEISVCHGHRQLFPFAKN
jgi:hypothetical protein